MSRCLWCRQACKEKWFGVEYTKESVSDAVVSGWKTAAPNAQLALPKPNPFIPRDFAFVSDLDGATADDADVSCRHFAFGSLWYKPDRHFHTPRAHVAFHFHLPSVMQGVESVVVAGLYVKLVRDALNEYSYHANVAELMYSLRVKESGLELMFGGFNDKLSHFVAVVTRALFGTPINSARFAVVKQEMLREFRNSLVKVAHKAKYLRLQLLERVAYPLGASIAALEAVTVASLESFVKSRLWAAKTHVSSFAHGNISAAAAAELHEAVEADLMRLSAALTEAEIPKRFIHELPATPSGLLLEAASEHSGEKNTQVEFYYQLGEHSVDVLAYADLLEQLMEEPLFDTLRTKQELGYDVSCTVRVTHGIVGFGVMVQSSLFDAAYITYCVDRFMVEFKDAIVRMPSEHFRDHVRAQILKKLEPDHNLLETTQRYWHEIASGRLAFALDQQLAKELERCTKSELVKRYDAWFLTTPKKLVVHVVGQASQPARSAIGETSAVPATAPVPVRISDLYAFKQDLPVYPDNTRAGAVAMAATDTTEL